MSVSITPANDGVHKYTAVFTTPTQTIHFGAKDYEDYTQHHNPIRKRYYISRHQRNEDWTNPRTAGALSRWILWETPHLQTNIRKFKERFNLS
jgi:hypothetical protein